jgi:MFS family permease
METKIPKSVVKYMARNVRLLKVVHVADSSIFLWPVVILYYYRVVGNAAGAGVVLATMAIVSAVAELPTGLLSDHYGRARTTQAATVLYFVSAFLLVLAYWQGFWMLIAAVSVQGVAGACESGNHDSLMYESCADKPAYARATSVKDMFGTSAGMVSAVIGGVVGSRSLLAVAAMSLLPRAVSLYASFGLKDVATHHKSGPKLSKLAELRALKDVLLGSTTNRLVVVGRVIIDGFGEVTWQYRALFIASVWPVWAVGLGQPISLAFNTLGGYISHRNADKKYNYLALMTRNAFVARTTAVVAYAVGNVWSPLMLGAAGVMFSGSKIGFNTYMHEKFTSRNRASAMSAVSLFATLLFAVASIVFGRMIDRYGVQRTTIIAGICGFSGAIFYLAAYLVDKRQENTTI